MAHALESGFKDLQPPGGTCQPAFPNTTVIDWTGPSSSGVINDG